MKAKVALLTLVLVSSALAGCTGDPGEGGGDEFDSEALQDLIDENLQDFMNNTSITVNNHFYNNTTVVNNDYDTNNDYNNTTNVDGGEINNYNQYTGSGAGSASIMQMFTVNWGHSDIILDGVDLGNRTVTLDGTLQQTNGEPTLIYAVIYNGNLIEFRNLTCEEMVNYRNVDDDEWRDWLRDNYGEANSDSSSVAQHLEDFFSNAGSQYSSSENSTGESVSNQCGFGVNQHRTTGTVFEIHLSQGEALEFLALPNLEDIELECDDGFSGSWDDGSVGNYLGGQADCTVSGIVEVYDYHHWNFTPDFATTNITFDTSGIPSWWPYNWWYFFDEVYQYSGETSHSSTPTSFAVYFTTYFVEVYDLDSE